MVNIYIPIGDNRYEFWNLLHTFFSHLLIALAAYVLQFSLTGQKIHTDFWCNSRFFSKCNKGCAHRMRKMAFIHQNLLGLLSKTSNQGDWGWEKKTFKDPWVSRRSVTPVFLLLASIAGVKIHLYIKLCHFHDYI